MCSNQNPPRASGPARAGHHTHAQGRTAHNAVLSRIGEVAKSRTHDVLATSEVMRPWSTNKTSLWRTAATSGPGLAMFALTTST